jgi:hypothetical protein
MAEIKTMRKKLKTNKSGYQCSFCGGKVSNPNHYYSSLTTILSMRLTGLLKANKSNTYTDGILDCINAVFGVSNEQARMALKAAGYLQSFEDRFRDKINEIGKDKEGKEKCYICGNYFLDHELTIDIISPYRTEFICEGCVDLRLEQEAEKDE